MSSPVVRQRQEEKRQQEESSKVKERKRKREKYAEKVQYNMTSRNLKRQLSFGHSLQLYGWFRKECVE